LAGAHSTELNPQTPHPVIALITEWQDRDGTVQARTATSDLGGTMRLGAQTCYVNDGTLAKKIYGKSEISERHRHRFEFNNRYLKQISDAGLVFSGFSRDGLAELIELPGHPWFFGTQFHPEFTSNPRDGHPLFTSFINAARECQGLKLPRAATA
ncbi:MAG TPA: gamma-glutamyl-gamma-aminobutyrate hydrolase family protein, partial [Gammaproteobacteria bacterium]|nr:gamma-glutamyl-gamma-aminobutyrate hydrolase family protein [Gammaproteobacteria bacterium]